MGAGTKDIGVAGGRTNAGELALRQRLRQRMRGKGTCPISFLGWITTNATTRFLTNSDRNTE